MSTAATTNGPQQPGEHYVRPRKQVRRGSTKMQPPLTPMIDVTFQLLLFFLLAFTFRLAEGQIPGALPKQGLGELAAEDTLNQPIRVMLYPAGANDTKVKYEIEGHSAVVTSGEALYQVLEGRKQALRSDEGPVIIKPDADVQWRYVVEVFNQSVRARFKNIVFAQIGA